MPRDQAAHTESDNREGCPVCKLCVCVLPHFEGQILEAEAAVCGFHIRSVAPVPAGFEMIGHPPENRPGIPDAMSH